MYYHLYDDMEPELDPLAGWSNEEELMELIDYNETRSPNTLEMRIKASADGTIHIDRHGEFSTADTVAWKMRWIRKQLAEVTRSIETYESVIAHNELELKSLQMNLEVRIKDIPYFKGLVNRTRMELKDAEQKLVNLDTMYTKKLETYIKSQIDCNMLIVDHLRELYKSKISKDVMFKLEADYDYITENGFDPTIIAQCLRNKENPVDSYIAYTVIYNMGYYQKFGITRTDGNDVYQLRCKFNDVITEIDNIQEMYYDNHARLAKIVATKKADLQYYIKELNARLNDADSECDTQLKQSIKSSQACLSETMIKLNEMWKIKEDLTNELAELKKS